MDIKSVLEHAVKRGELSPAEMNTVIAEFNPAEFSPAGSETDQPPEEPEKDVVTVLKEEDSETSSDIRARLLEMTIGQKIKLAMLGNSVARSLLIFNPNKMIQEFVLKNPRLTEGEIHAYLKSTNISEHALRIIAGDKDMMKSYISRLNLVSNPKAPPDIAVKWIRYINQTDLKKLAKSKNVAHVVQTTARRLVSE